MIGASGLIGTWLVSLAAPAVRQILLSIGMGVVSYAAISTVLNNALGAAKGSFAGMSGDIAALMHLAGAGEALSIIAGGMIAKVAATSLKRIELMK